MCGVNCVYVCVCVCVCVRVHSSARNSTILPSQSPGAPTQASAVLSDVSPGSPEPLPDVPESKPATQGAPAPAPGPAAPESDDESDEGQTEKGGGGGITDEISLLGSDDRAIEARLLHSLGLAQQVCRRVPKFWTHRTKVLLFL